MLLWKEGLINQVENSDKDEILLTVTELSMAVSAFINIVKNHDKRLVILNRGKPVAIISPYITDEARGGQDDQ